MNDTQGYVPTEKMVDVVRDADYPVTEGDIAEGVGVTKQTIANRRGEIVETPAVQTREIDRANTYWWNPPDTNPQAESKPPKPEPHQAAAWYVVLHVYAAAGFVSALIATILLHVMDGPVIYHIGVLVLLPILLMLSWSLVSDGRVRKLIKRITGRMTKVREIEQQMGGML